MFIDKWSSNGGDIILTVSCLRLFFGHFLTFVFSNICHFIMERYTIQYRIEIVRFYHQNLLSVRQTFRELREI